MMLLPRLQSFFPDRFGVFAEERHLPVPGCVIAYPHSSSAVGVEHVETVSHGQSYDPRTHTTIRHDRRTGTMLRTRYRHVVEASYKNPQLSEQEFRTKLATLRIGERLVRDRGGVCCERVVPVRPPWLRRTTNTATHALVERLRQQHFYQTCPPLESVIATDSRPDAAARLRRQMGE